MQFLKFRRWMWEKCASSTILVCLLSTGIHLALRPKLTTNLDWAWFKSAQDFYSAFKIQEGRAQRPRQPGGVTS